MATNSRENDLWNAVFVFTTYNGYNELLCPNDGSEQALYVPGAIALWPPASDQSRMTIHHDSLPSALPKSNINFCVFHAQSHDNWMRLIRKGKYHIAGDMVHTRKRIVNFSMLVSILSKGIRYNCVFWPDPIFT